MGKCQLNLRQQNEPSLKSGQERLEELKQKKRLTHRELMELSEEDRRERKRLQGIAWRREHPEKVKQYNEDYYDENAEELCRDVSEYYYLHKDPSKIKKRGLIPARVWDGNKWIGNIEYGRDYWKKNIEKSRKWTRITYRRHYGRLRKLILDFFGGKCARCGFNDPRALQIDHIHGGGSKELRGKGGGGTTYLKRVLGSLERHEKKYQILCSNCNWIKRSENGEHNQRRDK